MPVDIDDDAFEQLVTEALDQIPVELAQHMENVVILIEDRPSPAQQRGYRGMLLGLYQGVALTKRGPLSYHNTMPDRITIFKEPHCRITRSEAALRKRVAQTVIHEVGHHFGIGDARLRELGW